MESIMAGVTLAHHGPINRHHIGFGPTIALLVTSSMLFGVGSLLLLQTVLSYIKRRKNQTPNPLFFVSAIFSGVNLLALCAMHIKLTRIKLGTSLGSAAFSLLLSKSEKEAQYGMDHQPAQIILQLENISVALLGFVLLMRVRTLFPDERRIQRMVRILFLACGASFLLSLGLQWINAPFDFLGLRDSLKWMVWINVFHIHLYIAGCLSFIVNGFATWTLIARWRYTKRVTSTITLPNSPKSIAFQRLKTLIYAGLLLGVLQLSWYIYFTVVSIDVNKVPWPKKEYDYVLPRFIFYAGSSLYPVATYVATHWNTPSEEIHYIDLFGIPDGQDCDVALDNLGHDPTGVDGFNGDVSLINVDTLPVHENIREQVLGSMTG